MSVATPATAERPVKTPSGVFFAVLHIQAAGWKQRLKGRGHTKGPAFPVPQANVVIAASSTKLLQVSLRAGNGKE